MTMAYVFWHSPAGPFGADAYEAKLTAFHAALAEAAPEGLLSSRVLRFEALPWLPKDRPIYEDSYLVAGFRALEVLEQAAVSGALLAPHNAIARLAGDATAGLYKLRAGELQAVAPECVEWFSKPAGESYQGLYDRIKALAPGCELWGRQLVLGPAPEFCLRAEAPVLLAHEGVQRFVAGAAWTFRVGGG